MSTATTQTIADRIEDLDWPALTARMDEDGFVQTPPVLGAVGVPRAGRDASRTGAFARPSTCAAIASARASTSTSTRRCPSSSTARATRSIRRWPALANEWAQRLGEPATFPAELDDFLARCHRAGQRRTTPLILRYREGGHNTLHQDVYGEVAFPLQVVTMLDRPGEDFEGGQFVLLEQRPRAQSRAHVIDLERGAFLIFPTRHRPVLGTRGHYRANMRHGVATVRSGRRTTLGVIFHDAA